MYTSVGNGLMSVASAAEWEYPQNVMYPSGGAAGLSGIGGNGKSKSARCETSGEEVELNGGETRRSMCSESVGGQIDKMREIAAQASVEDHTRDSPDYVIPPNRSRRAAGGSA